jgi:pimeloyl-ACP methyl ester carboxylesterase
MINKLQLNDFDLSYSTEGEGRDVLFLHGFPSNMYFWNDIKNDLKEKLRVTVVEQRGYPLSFIEDSIMSDFNIENLSLDIEELINRLELTNDLIIVGHDWGSIVAWAVASRGNVEIKKLVSICGGTEFPSTNVYDNLVFEKGHHYISSFQNPEQSNGLLSKNLDLFFRSAYRVTPKTDHNLLDLSLNSLFTTYNLQNKIHNIDIESLVIHFQNGIKQAISWYSNIDFNLELSNQWRRPVDIEVTFLFGENDAAVKLNDKMTNRLKLSGTKVSVKEVKNADHWLPLTHKESVVREII